MLWPQVVQLSPLGALPSNDPPGLAWHLAQLSVEAAKNQTDIDGFSGATRPAAGASIIFFLLEPGVNRFTPINFHIVFSGSDIAEPILTPETMVFAEHNQTCLQGFKTA